ncbi:PLD nuclease N-terminal domain-containing protein [Pseudomonas sp. PD9R]|uniref:PLD nuclease N-terminal domain-containing protein n=1 Tax=Pseudomonas sp. PD9R TaxID=2853534 RepID=UPI001C47123D|nr:PLD nuclease N-terminal domain-containing protein [Pseudomonas sp. PD9R]MBV6824649.1 PLD nuclease N-terminal domain-containing protein [Pseudomonas sp. PD9R]
MPNETTWIVLAAVLLLIELWAINRVRKSEGKASTKGVWMVVIVFVPLIGLILWALVGPKHIAHSPNSAQARQ